MYNSRSKNEDEKELKSALENYEKAQKMVTKAMEKAERSGSHFGESISMEIGTNCTDHGCSYCIKLNDKYNQLTGKVETLENDRRTHEQRISKHDAKFDILESHLNIKFNELNTNLNQRIDSLEALFKNYLEPLVTAFPQIFPSQ